jgi:predicted nucleic acid-binding protein
VKSGFVADGIEKYSTPQAAAELILADTSIWIDHFRSGNRELRKRLDQVAEVRRMIEDRRLYNVGVGLTDAHLIASVLIDSPTPLWTRDKRLCRTAEALGIHAGLA